MIAPRGSALRFHPAAMAMMGALAIVLLSVDAGLAAKGKDAPPTIARFSLSELVSRASLICVCHMTGQQSEWDSGKNMLVTVVSLQADEVLKGTAAAGSDLQVDLFSSFTSEQLNVGGAAFEQGERAVLFLTPAGGDAKRYNIVGWAQGKFTIRTNPKTGEERVVRRLEGIHFAPSRTGEDGGEMPKTLGELRRAIQAAVTGGGGGASAP
ncbi:MAG TPA: hypothetical protein VML36_09480 [Nitrospiria bacterium]|nr:hypothetical protein [Nitrospiria bacterium]